MKLPAQTESQLQRQIVQALPLVLRPGVMWTHLPAGGARNKVVAAKLKAEGLQPGWPDLQFVYGGQIYFLEIKRKGGRASPAQRDVMDGLRGAGAEVSMAFSVDDAIAALASWKLLRGSVVVGVLRVASASNPKHEGRS